MSITCPYPTQFLVNDICYCIDYTDAVCSQNSSINFYSAFQFFSAFYTAGVVAIFIFYTIEVKLQYAYRIFNLFQFFSFAIQFQTFYYGQTEYFLRFLYRSNGGFFLDYRNQSLVINYATPSVIGLCLIIVWYFSAYWLIQTFVKKYESYTDYLKDNVYKFLEIYYFFQSKQAFYYIVLVAINLMNSQTVGTTLGPLVIYSLLLIIFIVITIYKHHKKTLSHAIYPKTFYIYTMFSNMSVAVIPLLKLNFLVYVVPYGLYLIIMVIGEHEKLNKQIVILYILEIILFIFPIVFTVVSSDVKNIIGLVSLIILILAAYIDVIYRYVYVSSQIKNSINQQNIFNTQQNTVAELEQQKARQQLKNEHL